jgi:hypothetical protein
MYYIYDNLQGEKYRLKELIHQGRLKVIEKEKEKSGTSYIIVD